MVHHCTHITQKFGMSLEALQDTTHQNSAIPQIPRTTSISLNTTAQHTSVGIIQYTGHIQIWQTYYHICSQLAQLQPTIAHIMMQKKPVTLPRNCTRLTGTATTKIYAASGLGLTNLLQHNLHNVIP